MLFLLEKAGKAGISRGKRHKHQSWSRVDFRKAFKREFHAKCFPCLVKQVKAWESISTIQNEGVVFKHAGDGKLCKATNVLEGGWKTRSSTGPKRHCLKHGWVCVDLRCPKLKRKYFDE